MGCHRASGGFTRRLWSPTGRRRRGCLVTNTQVQSGLFVLAAAAAMGFSLPAAAAQSTFATLGAEADQEGGYLVLANVAGGLSGRTTWDFGVMHSETSASRSNLNTMSYDGGVRHDFGRVGLRIGAGVWRDSAIVDTSKLLAAVDFHSDTWSVALEGELRGNDFAPFDVSTTIVRRTGESLTINARADCQIDDAGLGIRLGFSQGAWLFSVSGMSYDYDEADCAFSSAALAVLRRATRDEFVQFADNLTRVLALGAGNRVLAQTSLLDSRIGAGLQHEGDRRNSFVAFDRLEDAFFGSVSNTLSGGVGFILRSGHEVDVYAGTTDSDSFGTTGFIGFTFVLGL